jgi:hypothetical protein
MIGEARREKGKQRWWIKTLLKHRAEPTVFAYLSTEDGSGFRNFTTMRTSGFELLVTVIGPKVSRQDTNYNKCMTVNEITFDSFVFLGLLIPSKNVNL